MREEHPAEASLYDGLAYLAEGYGRFFDSSRDEKELKEGLLSEATAKAVAENMVGRLEDVSADGLAAD